MEQIMKADEVREILKLTHRNNIRYLKDTLNNALIDAAKKNKRDVVLHTFDDFHTDYFNRKTLPLEWMVFCNELEKLGFRIETCPYDWTISIHW